MYTSIAEFVADWQNESQATQKVFDALTDNSLNQKVYDSGRSLGKIAWHIVQTLPEMNSQAGLELNKEVMSQDVPTSSKTIADNYKQLAAQLIEEIQNKWTDNNLAEVIEVYGEQWTRAKVLDVLIRHEIHHRAQLTVLMRQAGLKVPGLYGPSLEEWVNYGAPPQD